jgi:energy-coupling factor transporter ATP-binding protein EcfA2
MPRNFVINEAKRQAVPLLIGLVGASGSGKTGSALELAHGIQDVAGGDIGAIDTEANRMLHYAGAPFFSDKSRKFKFKHLPFGAPFNPASYQEAIEALIKAGCKTIIVDSMSHEHEGPGGVLEMHEAELTARAGQDWDKSNRATFACWAKPKAERRALINYLLQKNANFIFCFRAKEKMKPVPGKAPMEMGWQPIAGEEFVYEMTVKALFMPGSEGKPTWMPELNEEKKMVKRPEHFKAICTDGRVMSAQMGREMALWAKGDAVPEPAKQTPPPATPATPAQAEGKEPEFELDGAKPSSPAPAATGQETPGVKALRLNTAIQKCTTEAELLKYRDEVIALDAETKAMVAPVYNEVKKHLKGAAS